MKSSSAKFIACGMYAFTDELQSAWREFFEIYFEIVGACETSLRFDYAPASLLDPELYFGHTCGYPLMTRLKRLVMPFCVPIFDVPGTNGRFYSSRFIVGANSTINSVGESRGLIAAMNTTDSNSGMNVFRHAIAQIHGSGPFFSSVLTSGGHLFSLQAVADGSADIAAIDCVSFQLIEDQWPELTRQVRTIGFSEQTCGLPFVLPVSDPASINPEAGDSESITLALNQALERTPASVLERLHLSRFETIRMSDYETIMVLENQAIGAGYPRLR